MYSYTNHEPMVVLITAVNFKNMTEEIEWIKENTVIDKISNYDIPSYETYPTAHNAITRNGKLVMCPNKHNAIARDDELAIENIKSNR